ncbi:MAG: hypothetical protein M1816_004467 [Peltula sp. TS41687]|nr:MAG: hypothetical protein M1816_004467 [Peltula sp. TS41687]
MVTRGRVPDDQIVSLLSEYLPNSTIVRVNYRWDDQHRFPIAVHDTLAAYDWILKNLIDVSPNTSDDEPSPAPAPRMPRIGLCGELIGGGLATMLALTECQAGKPSITAAAVNSPVLDWTFGLDQSTSSSSSSGDAVTAADGEQDLPIPTSTHPKKRPSKGRTHHSSWTQFSSNARLSAKDLSRARDMFFRTPDSYFDPFASPVLFFRTAGVDLPTDEDPSLLVPDPTIQATSTTNTTSKPHRRTTTHRRYPPTGMGLQLPSMRISVGKENILLDQGAELASLMRRSILISETQAGEKFADHENIADPKLFDGGRNDGRERVQLVRREGTALWCYPDEGGSTPSGVKEAGEWLEEVLRVT